MQKTLYLDCDGVILPACEYTSELLDVSLQNSEVIWISDREIEIENGVIHYGQDFQKSPGPAAVAKLYQIRLNPSRKFWKHERLDLRRDFVWLDDAPMGRDRDFLDAHGLADRLIIVQSWKPETVKACIDELKNDRAMIFEEGGSAGSRSFAEFHRASKKAWGINDARTRRLAA